MRGERACLPLLHFLPINDIQSSREGFPVDNVAYAGALQGIDGLVGRGGVGILLVDTVGALYLDGEGEVVLNTEEVGIGRGDRSAVDRPDTTVGDGIVGAAGIRATCPPCAQKIFAE